MFARAAAFALPLLTLPLLALGACATAPETRVTRFHLDQPIAPAAIVIEARDSALANLGYETYAQAVNGELARQGFTPAARTAAELVAVVDVQREYSAGPIKPPPFSIGIGGATFGRSVGLGGGVTVPVGKARTTELVQTNLAVQIKRRSDNTIIWEGRAITQAKGGSEEAAAANAAPRLAAALFGGFPGESGRTISVK